MPEVACLSNLHFHTQFWVGVLGLTAALASFRSGWKATALPFTAHTTDTDDVHGEDTPIILDSIPPQSRHAISE
jgi:hypothetical protein